MNALLVLAVVVGAVSADVSLGYHYKVPHTSYGVPSYQVDNNYNTAYSSAGASNVYKGPSGYQGLSVGQNGGYQGGYAGLQSGVGTSSGLQSTGSGTQYYQVPSSGSSSVIANTLLQPSYQYQTQYQHKYQQQYQIQQQPAQVFKHYYVHAAPEEPEPARPRNPVVLPAPQKHYKIIFIKTPVQTAVAPQYIPVQQQNEEKTIVYVLVKKPEEYQDVVIPKVEQKPPSKPEVYFIKYNSKEDSQSVINNIVSDFSNKGQSASFSSVGGDASSGSFSGQSVLGSGVSSTSAGSGSSLITGVSSAGGFAEQPDVGSGQIATTQTENELIANFGSPFGQSVQSDTQQASFGSGFGSGTSGVGSLNLAAVETSDNGASSAFSSSTANYDSVNTISTSQGVPHETYGVPKFKVK
ncbi:hypothetical protein evm_008900 [Chilo suppressalis]|nr:hypothetical protein evm_008900 [Chilo suppressalis]